MGSERSPLATVTGSVETRAGGGTWARPRGSIPTPKEKEKLRSEVRPPALPPASYKFPFEIHFSPSSLSSGGGGGKPPTR